MNPDNQVKRLDDKNQQFSADVLEKHNYIKELISDTKTGLQVLQVKDDDEEQVDDKMMMINQHQNSERDSGELRHCERILPFQHRGRQQ